MELCSCSVVSQTEREEWRERYSSVCVCVCVCVCVTDWRLFLSDPPHHRHQLLTVQTVHCPA